MIFIKNIWNRPCFFYLRVMSKEGPEETIDNGINGYLVEEGNVQQFADCAIKLMKNETLLKQFASKTKKDLDRFNTAAIINQWVELLRNM